MKYKIEKTRCPFRTLQFPRGVIWQVKNVTENKIIDGFSTKREAKACLKKERERNSK